MLVPEVPVLALGGEEDTVDLASLQAWGGVRPGMENRELGQRCAIQKLERRTPDQTLAQIIWLVFFETTVASLVRDVGNDHAR